MCRTAVLMVAATLALTSVAAADQVEAALEPEAAEPAPDPAAPDPTEPTVPEPPEQPQAPASVPRRPKILSPQRLAELSASDREVFDRGSYSDAQHLGGGVLAIVASFGVGHLAQGRWLERGWLFTATQGIGLATLLYGKSRARDECAVGERCTSTGVKIYVGGIIAVVASYGLGVLDAFIVPPRHNARLRRIHRRVYVDQVTVMPYIAPSRDDTGGVAGLSLTF